MKKAFFILVPSLVLAVITFLVVQILMGTYAGKGALQVTSSPESKVYLNGKYLGETPFPRTDGQNIYQAGDYTIKLEPVEGGYPAFEEKVTLSKSTLTVVDRKFGKEGGSEGSVISLSALKEKNDAQLLVISFPDKSEVYLDSNLVGLTPVLLKNLTTSDHKLTLKKNGYREKIVPIRTPAGYKVQSVVYMAISDLAEITPTPTAALTPTPTASPAASLVTILTTPTGFLRVREDSTVSGAEIGRVLPGETYPLVDEISGWFKIKLKNGTEGWISSQYATK